MAFSVAVSIVLYYCVAQWVFPGWPIYKIATLSSMVVTCTLALLSSNFFWRPLWRIVVRFNGSVYPDLNGTWEGTIMPNPSHGAKVSEIPIRARIRQSTTDILIDFYGETVKSVTLSATPRIYQGQHFLYYIYRAEPRGTVRPPYEGTTTLRVQTEAKSNKPHLTLSGQYYTVRQTAGEIRLIQIGKNPNQDVSYY
ncbi:hypothetical protein OV207_04345 [Corallococcus sp. BB11-1]|uniref:Cap15 family cyclic dinucleotide receptor domain-containing protein n=1 Tax=Corallococcus sp. BB11-1 TaxID=2996783 RepID=UPI00226FA1CB|nr:hypothetical protein [Corallococcus sp. BB11-1]MCY1030677.1 hypothetical protein [Corallococcus sp. BB11-1]